MCAAMGWKHTEKLKVNRYDGVILDVNMPRMGGLEHFRAPAERTH